VIREEAICPAELITCGLVRYTSRYSRWWRQPQHPPLCHDLKSL